MASESSPASNSRAPQWAVRLLLAQIVAGVLFAMAASVSKFGVVTAILFYAGWVFGLVALFSGIQAAVSTWRGKWLLVSIASVLIWIIVAWHGFACCARWGS